MLRSVTATSNEVRSAPIASSTDAAPVTSAPIMLSDNSSTSRVSALSSTMRTRRPAIDGGAEGSATRSVTASGGVDGGSVRGARYEDRSQAVDVGRLDQMMVEARASRALAIVVLSPAGERNQQHVVMR